MTGSELLEKLRLEISGCLKCKELAETRTQTVFGDGTIGASVLFVGEAPGADEDRQGVPFVGKAGQLMDSAMRAAGIPRKMVYIANVLKCRPPDNRDPLPDEIDNCRPFLAAQITLIKPKIICTLGRFGLQQLLKGDYKISEVHGKPIRSKDNTIYFPMYHPAAALHNGALRESILEDFKRLAALLKREGILK